MEINTVLENNPDRQDIVDAEDLEVFESKLIAYDGEVGVDYLKETAQYISNKFGFKEGKGSDMLPFARLLEKKNLTINEAIGLRDCRLPTIVFGETLKRILGEFKIGYGYSIENHFHPRVIVINPNDKGVAVDFLPIEEGTLGFTIREISVGGSSFLQKYFIGNSGEEAITLSDLCVRFKASASVEFKKYALEFTKTQNKELCIASFTDSMISIRSSITQRATNLGIETKRLKTIESFTNRTFEIFIEQFTMFINGDLVIEM